MLEKSGWLEKAAALPPGRRARVDHVCGPGRTLLIRHEQNGELHAYCFRCNEPGFHRPHLDLAALVAKSRALAAADSTLRVRAADSGPVLPQPLEHDVDDWPPAARLWLFKAGLGRDEIRLLGAAYHRETDRVVLPLHSLEGKLAYWTARAYQPKRLPKYLGASERPSTVLAFRPVVGDTGGLFGTRSAGSSADGAVRLLLRQPVLTEDALSAFKISLAGFEAWPVMGTSIPSAYIAELMRRGGATLWLDPDAAGQQAQARYMRQLKAYGIPVRPIRSARDPKLHFINEIQEHLS